MLYNILILPIETIVDWVFNFFINKFTSFGIIGAVLGVSLVINFLALPLYNIADALQEKERKVVMKLEPRVSRIKKTFKGNERFMILSTYYRQNDYNPIYVLRSSLSILIEIPFFIAAYHYLSNCEALKGSSFWIFKDLGLPDGLLSIGNFKVHILPIIMTLINFISGAIYTKSAPFREKIQLYIVAILFLVLLYTSPSGLVIYWILNNLFSLVKNIVKQMTKPGKVLHILISILLSFITIYFYIDKGALWKCLIFTAFTVMIIFLPFFIKKFTKEFEETEYSKKYENVYFFITIMSGIALAILYGYLLPSSVIATSPVEFSYLGTTDSPMTYVWSNLSVYIGFFIVWPIVIFKMFGHKTKEIESISLCILLFISLVNVFVFKANYSNLNSLFEFDNPLSLVQKQVINLISLLVYCLIIFFSYFLFSKKITKQIPFFLIALCVAEFGLGTLKVISIKNNFKLISSNNENKSLPKIEKHYHLSKTGKNVVVIFLDRAVSYFIPKIMDENPEIKKQFQGFTFYENTISFSDFTIQGADPLYGGYEYTQEKMNSKTDVLLRDKHNEALLVMPKLFADAGFESTITDPSWPNYHAKGDLAFSKKYSDINVKELAGKYYSAFKYEKGMEDLPIDILCKKGCIDFSILQCLPPFIRITFYNYVRRKPGTRFSGDNFFSQLSNLYFLPQMTAIDSQKNTYTFIENETTHEVYVNLANDYETIAEIQNDNEPLKIYQANVAAIKQIGKYLDYLREMNIYDNTRLIIVSDHGENRGDKLKNSELDINMIRFSALLLEKDFNSNSEFIINNQFMTNADTISLAIQDLPISKVNPFSGQQIRMEKDGGVNIYHCVDLNPEHFRNAKQFELNLNEAWHVSNNIYQKENWIPLIEWTKQMEY